MICVKFDEQLKNPEKPKFGLFRFLAFLKNLENLGFFGAIFQPCLPAWKSAQLKRRAHERK